MALSPKAFQPRRNSRTNADVTGTYFAASVLPLVIANMSTR